VGQTALIAFLLLATAVALFAVQNAGPVVVRFGFWSLEMSLVVVILVATALGAVMASLVSLPAWFRDRRRLRHQTKELQTLRASRTPAAPSPTPSAESASPWPPEPPSPSPPARSL
jgi:lipopolysaccharide assembly protein A